MGGKRFDESGLAQDWIHSHEEDTDTTMVFRPAGFRFPPSRGRMGFHLRPGGKLTARKPGPTDRTEVAAGSWKLSGEQLELSPRGEDTRILHVESLEPDRLVVKKAPSRQVR
jgi:hypothetical protein